MKSILLFTLTAFLSLSAYSLPSSIEKLESKVGQLQEFDLSSPQNIKTGSCELQLNDDENSFVVQGSGSGYPPAAFYFDQAELISKIKDARTGKKMEFYQISQNYPESFAYACGHTNTNGVINAQAILQIEDNKITLRRTAVCRDLKTDVQILTTCQF